MSVTANKNRLFYSQVGGSENVVITYTGSGTYVQPVVTYDTGSGTGWLTVNALGEQSQDVVEYSVTATPYTNYSVIPIRRSGKITFQDSTGSLELRFYQANGYVCIWQDYYYIPDATAGENYSYVIKINNNTIFEGMTVPLSDTATPESINLSRLVESYLNSYEFSPDNEEDWFDLNNLVVDFYKKNSDGTETWKNRFYFANDWSNYNRMYNSNGTLNCLNDPINGHGCNGSVGSMYFPFCVYNSDGANTWRVLVDKTTGASETVSLGAPDYPFSVYNISNGFDNEKKMRFNKGNTNIYTYDLTYDGQGVIYYRNRFGGWDSFLIEGNIYKSEDYTKEQYTTVQSNLFRNSWGKVTDKNTITTSYEVSTGWLTDEQARKLVFHLLSSPTVFFKPFYTDLEYNSYLPISVNITNSRAEYKKFKNGRKLINYTITFDESRTKIVKK